VYVSKDRGKGPPAIGICSACYTPSSSIDIVEQMLIVVVAVLNASLWSSSRGGAAWDDDDDGK
jgi:hypothetical protein